MELNGQKRQEAGKAVKGLRKEGLIPAVVFGNEIDPTSIVLNRMEFSKTFGKAGETSLVDLKVDGTNYKVLINDIQFDPVSGQVIHTSLYKPNLKEKTEVEVPVEIIGADKNEMVKSGEAAVLQVVNEITVRALPTDLPEAFVVDVSSLSGVGAHVNVSQLEYDRTKVEIMHMQPEDLVVKLDEAKMEEEPVEEAAAEVSEQEAIEAMEATAEKKPEEEGEGEEAVEKPKEEKKK